MERDIAKWEIDRLFVRPERLPGRDIEIRNPNRPKGETKKIKYKENFAFLPPEPKLPDNYVRVGGIPIRKTPKGPVVPDIRTLRELRYLIPWKFPDWRIWGDLSGKSCTAVPEKTSRVEIPVLPQTRMCRVSGDCARIYTVNDSGEGCVVNVVTESVEAGFTVQTDPSYSHPNTSPVVHPFHAGGINHKYNRLYVPASFFTEARDDAFGGFYVAVIDIDPISATYLQTVDWISCGWIPEEVAFTDDEEIGVIANYMQATVTIFQASDGAILAQEVECFDGAAADGGGAYSRSVRCANVPGVGNRAFVTITNETPAPGIAVIDLDDPTFPRTNFALPGFNDGIAVAPENNRVLVVNGTTSHKLHVVRVDVNPFVLEQSIDLPVDGAQSYFGGIDVRGAGDIVFVATGSANSTAATQGTSLVMVNYLTGDLWELPDSLASRPWGIEVKPFGYSRKPHIVVCSLSGALTIIPC